MSFITQALDAIGINKDTAGNVASAVGVDAVVQKSLPVIQGACKQGTIIGIKEYAIPVSLGAVAIIGGLITLGVVIGKYAEKSRKKK